jgi:hypothetical protein
MKKFKQVAIDIDINVTKEKAWDVLFNRFGDINDFNPHLEASRHTKGVEGEVGCERKCDMDAKNSVVERIVDVRGTDGFDVDIIEGDLPMMDELKVSIDVKTISSNQTKVIFTVNFAPKIVLMTPLMKGMITKMFKKLLVGLKYHLETEELVTKSNINDIVKGFKKLQRSEAFVVKELAYA